MNFPTRFVPAATQDKIEEVNVNAPFLDDIEFVGKPLKVAVELLSPLFRIREVPGQISAWRPTIMTRSVPLDNLRCTDVYFYARNVFITFVLFMKTVHPS